MELGGPVEYIVTLAAGTGGIVNLRCMGKVLRLEPGSEPSDSTEMPYMVAVSLERYEVLRTNAHTV